MNKIAIALLTVLLPTSALAAPRHDRSDTETDVESDTVEWSTGRARLGLEVIALNPDLRAYFGAPKDSGLLVARVQPDSPAARAGVRVGDVITEVDGKRVQDATDIFDTLTRLEMEKTSNVPIDVVRAHESLDLQAKIAVPKSQGAVNSRL